MFYIILIILNIIILSCGYFIYKRKLQQKINIESKKYIEKNKKFLENAAEKEIDNLNRVIHEKTREIEKKTCESKDLDTRFDIAMKRLDEVSVLLSTQRESAKTYEESLRAMAQESAKTYEQDLMKIADTRVAEAKEKMWQETMKQHEELMLCLDAQAAQMNGQIQTLSSEIEAYSAKQAAINEAILRQRAIEEQQDFYRVCLPEEAIADIAELQVTRQKLKKPEIIDKIIYDTYVAKPVLEMIKRVLQNTTCSGIYKITCQETMEIYIGKSTDIKNRWQQHCKAAFNCGTIASSILHRKMRIYGLENFTFELLEKVPKDQLSERERYYIDFYKTKETGLNERNG